MASSKVMASSKPKNSDLASTSSSSAASRSRRFTSSSSSPSPSLSATKHRSSDRSTTVLRPMSSSSNMTVDGILSNVYSGPSSETTLLDGQITLIDGPAPPVPSLAAGNESSQLNGGSDDQEMAIAEGSGNKTVDDMWREIVSGRKELKEEPDEMMTLEDFLARAGAVEVGEDDDDEVKMPQLASERLSGGVFAVAFDPVPPPNAIHMLDKVEGSIVGFGNEAAAVVVAPSFGGLAVGRGKRGRAPPALEQLDKAAQQRQKRMIKNRESAARSRERKQAYQVELESLAVKLEEENEQLLREKEERTKERLKQLMEKVVPVVERRKPPPTLRRARSWVW